MTRMNRQTPTNPAASSGAPEDDRNTKESTMNDGKPLGKADGKYSLSQLVITAIITGIIALLFGLFNPTIQLYGERLRFSWAGPELSLEIYSVLISRDQADPVANVKLRVRAQNSGYSSKSIQMIYLRNQVTGDSIDLMSTKPFEIGPQSFARDSVTVQQLAPWNVFKEIPCREISQWQLLFRIPNEEDAYVVEATPSHLDHLHFFLTPAGKWRGGNRTTLQPVQISSVRNLYEFDSSQWHDLGLDSFVVMIYPPDQVAIELDLNSDGVADSIMLVNDMSEEHGFPGRIISINPNLDHYFDKISGFALAIRESQLIPDTVLFHWYSSSQQKDLARVFGSMVDEQIPLVGKEFIYWQYSIE